MEGRSIYMRLAEAWRAAEREATNVTLKSCYAGRAAHYLALAHDEEPEPDALGNRSGNCEECG